VIRTPAFHGKDATQATVKPKRIYSVILHQRASSIPSVVIIVEFNPDDGLGDHLKMLPNQV
jgi:hypothetical protein